MIPPKNKVNRADNPEAPPGAPKAVQTEPEALPPPLLSLRRRGRGAGVRGKEHYVKDAGS